jgi:hypothetical protein
MRDLVWLASYPRSGNTWLRIFLANYIANEDQPVKINELPIYGLGFQDIDPMLWKFVCGEEVPPHDVQIARRAEVQRAIPAWARELQAGGDGQKFFVKTHSYRGIVNGCPTIAEDCTFKSIYVVRDPRAVTRSHADFVGVSMAEVVAKMADPTAKIGGKNPIQHLSTWSRHVLSWQPHSLVIRNEDLPGDFRKVIAYLELPHEPKRLERAIKFSSMQELQRQEDADGFREARKGRFFGRAHEHIPEELARQIERDQEQVMRHFGYLH